MGKYFSIEELCDSETAKERGIDNTPSEYAIENMAALIDEILDPTRKEFGGPIIVESGFRNPELNTAVSGSATSQHMKGEAADIYASPRSQEENERIGRIIAKNGGFDQLIFENVRSKKDLRCQWIHVSFKKYGNNRGEIRCKIIGKSGHPKITLE